MACLATGRCAAVVAVLCIAASLPGLQQGSWHVAAETSTSPAPRKGAEKFTFQAEVNRLMDILINSLYSNKDVFLRELISNGADALDKTRFLSLTDKKFLGSNPDLEIRIQLDADKQQLVIRDTGVGMTKKDLINNLGTIAKSGTSAFLEQMQKSNDINLIGQFGVGFYSVYLVADYVEVASKHNDDKQYIWESSADGNFAISEDKTGEPLGRGTQITIHLKEEAQEYLDEAKLKELVAKYSEFINFPIYLYASHEVDEPVEEEEEEEAAPAADDADEVEDEEEEEEAGEAAAPKTVKKTVWDWEVLNDNKAIWLRSASDVSEEDYDKFYKAISKGSDSAMTQVHFKAEGDVEFRSILYIPGSAPPNFMENYYSNKAGLKLYVRRVFISDDFEELIPRYLNFLRGIVDSDSLPLSVSRETLQAHGSLKTIKKKLVSKALDTIRKLANDEAAEGASSDDSGEAGTPASSPGRYTQFWNSFGKAMKLGVIEDSGNKQRLAKLVRFPSTHAPEGLTSLDAYISRMPESQTDIYYLAGESKEEVLKSPFLERLEEEGLEVILFTDAIDEYMMQHLSEYDDRKLINISKDNLKLGGKDKDEKAADKALKDKFKELTAWWKDVLGTSVTGVKVSSRLAKSPAIVVTSQYGWSANMERIMRSQALSDNADKGYMKGMKTLEINPRHPLVEKLRVQVEKNKDADSSKALAKVLFDTALLESGFDLEHPQEFNSRVLRILADNLGIKGDLMPEGGKSKGKGAAMGSSKDEL